MTTGRTTGTIYVEYMPLSGVKFAPKNPKDHDLGGLQGSYERFGFVLPPTLDEATERLVAGHGRIKALRFQKSLGAPPPENIQVREDEWYVPVLRGVAFKDPHEAEAYLLADNRWPEVGGWREDDLLDMLQDHAASDGNALDGIGWDREDVDEMLADRGREIAVESTQKREKRPRFIECPHCGHYIEE